MGASAAGTEFGDRVVKAVTDVDGVFGADLCEAQEKNDGFIVDKVINIFERDASVPGTENKGLKGKVKSQVHLIELALMAILDGGGDASFRVARIDAAADHARFHVELETPMKRQFDGKDAPLVDDGLVRPVEVVGRDSEPRGLREEHAAERNIEKSLAEIGAETFRAGLVDKFSRGRVELVAKSQPVKIHIPVVHGQLHAGTKAEKVSELKLIRVLQTDAEGTQSRKSFAVAGEEKSYSAVLIFDKIIRKKRHRSEVGVDRRPLIAVIYSGAGLVGRSRQRRIQIKGSRVKL